MTPGEFAAIEARANAASAGPWESDGDYNRAEISQAAGGWATIVGTEEVGSGHLRENVLILSAADSQFIAHARVDIPALLAAVRERDNTIARVRALHVKGPSDGGCSNTDCKCHGYPTCLHCDEYNAKGVIWPCATIAALDPQETE